MIWIYLLIYGIAFGVLSSLAVKSKNRDQGAWFFAGLVFGVFGLLAALVVNKVENQTGRGQSASAFDSSQFTKKCPDCAESIKLEARVCRFCQHKFTEEEVEGAVNLRKDRFEQENKLPAQEVNQPLIIDRRKFNRQKHIVISLFIILLVAAAVLVYLHGL